jgi:hypothetical protein
VNLKLSSCHHVHPYCRDTLIQDCTQKDNENVTSPHVIQDITLDARKLTDVDFKFEWTTPISKTWMLQEHSLK